MLRGGLPGARWIDPENYHLTLRFIGDIDDVLAREIAFMLGNVRRLSFELRLDGLTSFGGRRPRAVVATAAPTQQLYELQAEHERLIRRIGLEPEGREFTRELLHARVVGEARHLHARDAAVARGEQRALEQHGPDAVALPWRLDAERDLGRALKSGAERLELGDAAQNTVEHKAVHD